jgi:hypothetical protein
MFYTIYMLICLQFLHVNKSRVLGAFRELLLKGKAQLISSLR